MSYTNMPSARSANSGLTSKGKPIPDPDDHLTRPFWEAAANGKLVIQQCNSCKQWHHPPVPICWHCQSTDLTFNEVSGKGHVYSFAVVKDQRMPAFDDLMPYVIANVTLDDVPGVFLYSNLPGTPIEDVKSGMAVTVDFEEIAQGVFIPQFRAA